MNRERFEVLLEAYGADFARWPEAERAAGEAFAAAHVDAVSVLIAEARGLDAVLDTARIDLPEPDLLRRRIVAKAPRAGRPMGLDRRLGWALAACAVFGIVLGYGGGMLAPVAEGDDAYFTMAFEAPFVGLGDEG
ncbi:MAG: hypothetical protein R3C16_05545 [Hyphomonadaceae bacterium]